MCIYASVIATVLKIVCVRNEGFYEKNDFFYVGVEWGHTVVHTEHNYTETTYIQNLTLDLTVGAITLNIKAAVHPIGGWRKSNS